MWEIPEDELRILPDVGGLDVLDLGCGTGYWCAWFQRLGARPVGLVQLSARDALLAAER
jgi:SAM-dependent methyltransferase